MRVGCLETHPSQEGVLQQSCGVWSFLWHPACIRSAITQGEPTIAIGCCKQIVDMRIGAWPSSQPSMYAQNNARPVLTLH